MKTGTCKIPLTVVSCALVAFASSAQVHIAEVKVVPPAEPDDLGSNALMLDMPRPEGRWLRSPAFGFASWEELHESATAGDLRAQTRLAEDRLGDGAPGLFEQNHAEAYKWAYIASSRGHDDARYLLAECDLFMSTEDRKEGKALVTEYLADQTKESETSERQKESGDTE